MTDVKSLNYKKFKYSFLYSINNITEDKLIEYKNEYLKDNKISIKNFIDDKIAKEINNNFKEYDSSRWKYAILTDKTKWKPKYLSINDKLLEKYLKNCDNCNIDKQFTYRFKRQIEAHNELCECITCKIYDVLKDSIFIKILEKITGLQNLKDNEINITNYSKNDFLSIHHDANKGDIAITLSFTDEWHPTYGGLLHFCDDDYNITKTVVPSLGALSIFKITENKTHHFVSHINVDKNRYVISAWYSSSNK